MGYNMTRMDSVLENLVAAAVGVLVSTGYLTLRVLPRKPSRDEVQEMIDRHIVNRRVRDLENRLDREYGELKGIREELGGLREDVTKLATTVELVLKRVFG